MSKKFNDRYHRQFYQSKQTIINIVDQDIQSPSTKWLKEKLMCPGVRNFSVGCPEKQQVAQNNTVSYMWVNICLKRHQNKFGRVPK